MAKRVQRVVSNNVMEAPVFSYGRMSVARGTCAAVEGRRGDSGRSAPDYRRKRNQPQLQKSTMA
jgi:hypothetical protein